MAKAINYSPLKENQMKKRIFTLFLIVVAALTAIPCSAGYFLTPCGIGGMCLDREAFESEEEFQDYLQDLNEIYCGNRNGSVFYMKDMEPIHP